MNESDQEVEKLVRDEIARAVSAHGEHFATDHEAFAVLLEEVDEIKAWVWRKRRERDRSAMVRELVQVAATAQKWAASLIEGSEGPRAVGVRQAAREIRNAIRELSAGPSPERREVFVVLHDLAKRVEELAKT
jgi:hypothetical protein